MAKVEFQALYEFGADVVLTGHDHIYERFAPQGPNAQADPNGIRVFVVGTGGAGLYGIGNVQPNSQVRNATTHGVLKLTLHPTRYDWEFIPVAGQTFRDSGGADCVTRQPQVTITASDATASEAGLNPGAFTVSRTGATTSALTVHYSVSGTATLGSDYTGLPGATGSLTIPSGASTATLTVTPVNDTLVEPNETVTVTVTPNAAYAVGTFGSATVTLTSDDVASVTVTITASDATASEAGLNPGAFTVSRTGATTSALTVHYSVSGTATLGSDYTGLPGSTGSLTIPSGALTATLPVTPVNDTLVESNETVVVTALSNTAYAVGTPGSATVTITSDDVASTTVTITASTASVPEAGPPGTFTVSRTGATTSALTVHYSVSGTATLGSDYTGLPGSTGSLTIPSGALTATLTVRPVNDTLVESNETVVVTVLSNTAYAVGTPGSATVTITSDDAGVPPGEVSLTAQSAYDNKNHKTYRAGGPDGVDPLNDLKTLAEEYKFEIEAGNGFWWEATYTDPVAGSAGPSKVLVTIHYRSETNWTGTFRVEYYQGTSPLPLASTTLPVNSSNDPAAGKGQKHTYVWNLSSVVTTVQALRDGRVRVINDSNNGKKVWVTYSVTTATLGAAP